MNDVIEKYQELLDKAKAKEEELEKAVNQGGKLKNIIIEIEEWIIEIEEVVEIWEPVSTDPDTAKKQLDDVKVSDAVQLVGVNRTPRNTPRIKTTACNRVVLINEISLQRSSQFTNNYLFTGY